MTKPNDTRSQDQGQSKKPSSPQKGGDPSAQQSQDGGQRGQQSRHDSEAAQRGGQQAPDQQGSQNRAKQTRNQNSGGNER